MEKKTILLQAMGVIEREERTKRNDNNEMDPNGLDVAGARLECTAV